jgi:hypothetical protein
MNITVLISNTAISIFCIPLASQDILLSGYISSTMEQLEEFAVPPRKGFAPQTREHSSFVWEGLRDRFTQLYSVQNKSLGEVMDLMETEHSFVATYAYLNLEF